MSAVEQHMAVTLRHTQHFIYGFQKLKGFHASLKRKNRILSAVYGKQFFGSRQRGNLMALSRLQLSGNIVADTMIHCQDTVLIQIRISGNHNGFNPVIQNSRIIAHLPSARYSIGAKGMDSKCFLRKIQCFHGFKHADTHQVHT